MPHDAAALATQDAAAEDAAGRKKPGFIVPFARLAGPFFTGTAGARPILLAALLLALTLAQVVIQIFFNIWNRDFFNALEARERAAFLYQSGVFLGLAAASMIASVFQLYIKQLLQLDWRAWLTDRLVQAWLKDGRHYQLGFLDEGADNPDQRIAEDARAATEMALDFMVGLATAATMLACFVGILWSISGALHVSLASFEMEIPGYMVWCALIYAVIGSTLTWLLGRPMVDINVRRNSAEADFRFGLVRVRESTESIALIRGEPDETRGLKENFSRVRSVWVELFRAQRNLMYLTSAYGSLAMIVPTMVASPRYFSGAITLGGLMQIGAAFAQVQISLNWFVDNFPRIAEWRAAVQRVLALDEAIEGITDLRADPDQSTIAVEEGDGSEIVVEDLRIQLADGTSVIAEANAHIGHGERVLIVGESGTGKSTLFRAMAGLWPWGGGRIVMPPAGRVLFMPQRPYLPLGTLRQALSYPHPPTTYSDAALRDVLQRMDLARHEDRLDEEARWDQTLSLGEQQRLAFARLLLQKPAWVFMDEATSALDEQKQDAMMEAFIEALPDASLISIGHRPGLEAFHTAKLTLLRGETGARLAGKRPARAAGGGLLRRAARRLPLGR
jgi:putative ATP-binding cassette transporter